MNFKLTRANTMHFKLTPTPDGGMILRRVAFAPELAAPYGAHREAELRTCENCAQSVSRDPKCGLCCGPVADITRWQPLDAK
jgi:hypothetical protein